MGRLYQLAAVACSLLSGLATLVVFAAAPEQPNVVVIVADDLGFGDVSYNGGSIPTPALDSLAKSGVKLERFYTAPLGTATRSALMTGRDPIRLGLTYSELYGWDNLGVHPGEHFMSQSFRQAGYQTAAVGVWSLGHAQQTFHPNERGFEIFWGQLLRGSNLIVPYDNIGGVDLQVNGQQVKGEGFVPAMIGEQAVRFVQGRDASKPFFLYLPFVSSNVKSSVPARRLSQHANHSSPAFAASVAAMDSSIEQLVTALKKNSLYDNTIILFMSDNGGEKGIGNNGSFVGGRGETFEGGVRVPAFISWPGKLAGDKSFNGTVSVMDVLPTLTTAAKVALKNERSLDGLDQWSALKANKALKDKRTLFFASEARQYGFFHLAAMTENWKLVQTVDQDLIDIRVENQLFKVVNGVVDESQSLAATNSSVVDSLSTDLVKWRARQPITGLRNTMVPSLGWRGPIDWAQYPIPLDLLQKKTAAGVPPPIARRPLDFQLGEKGRLIYDCEQKWWSLGFCLTEVDEDIKVYSVHQKK